MIIKPTPTLESLLNDVIDKKLYETNIAMPAIVESFNAAEKTCQARPALQRKNIDGTFTDLPIINDIPVCFPQTNEALISFPLIQGDNVLLIFSQRSLDNWKESAGARTLDPDDFRKNHISDAIAIPGILKKGGGIAAESDKMKIAYKDAKITINSSSKFRIENTAEELLQIISDALTELVAATTNTSLGLMHLNNASAFSAIKSRLGNLKG